VPVLTGDLDATVNEGESYALDATDLNYTDPDDDNGVIFTVTNQSNGTVQVSGLTPPRSPVPNWYPAT